MEPGSPIDGHFALRVSTLAAHRAVARHAPDERRSPTV